MCFVHIWLNVVVYVKPCVWNPAWQSLSVTACVWKPKCEKPCELVWKPACQSPCVKLNVWKPELYSWDPCMLKSNSWVVVLQMGLWETTESWQWNTTKCVGRVREVRSMCALSTEQSIREKMSLSQWNLTGHQMSSFHNCSKHIV